MFFSSFCLLFPHFSHSFSSAVSIADIAEFVPGREPFRTFSRAGTPFTSHLGITAALLCSETGVTPPDFAWPLWRDPPPTSTSSLKSTFPADAAMFSDPLDFTTRANLSERTLLFGVGQLVHVDHGAGTFYLARILDAEQWDADGGEENRGVGPHYHVHYHGWSERHNEWVPQCRVKVAQVEKGPPSVRTNSRRVRPEVAGKVRAQDGYGRRMRMFDDVRMTSPVKGVTSEGKVMSPLKSVTSEGVAGRRSARVSLAAKGGISPVKGKNLGKSVTSPKKSVASSSTTKVTSSTKNVTSSSPTKGRYSTRASGQEATEKIDMYAPSPFRKRAGKTVHQDHVQQDHVQQDHVHDDHVQQESTPKESAREEQETVSPHEEHVAEEREVSVGQECLAPISFILNSESHDESAGAAPAAVEAGAQEKERAHFHVDVMAETAAPPLVV